jgi:hypothetical protein
MFWCIHPGLCVYTNGVLVYTRILLVYTHIEYVYTHIAICVYTRFVYTRKRGMLCVSLLLNLVLHNGPIELHVDLVVEAMFEGSCFCFSIAGSFDFNRNQSREDEALLWPRGGHEEMKRNFETTISRLCVV